MPHFDLPLDLPHAGRIAARIFVLLERHCEENGVTADEALDLASRLDGMLVKYVGEEENPDEAEAEEARRRASDLGRRLVAALEESGIRGDRLGQYVRNLFECLALGEEGARISLRAG